MAFPEEMTFKKIKVSGDLLAGVLPKRSRIKVNTVFTLEKSSCNSQFWQVRESVMEKVKKEFYDVF